MSISSPFVQKVSQKLEISEFIINLTFFKFYYLHVLAEKCQYKV